MSSTFLRDSLVWYKAKPAVVMQAADKLDLLLPDGKSISVRPKDVLLLHRGPATLRNLIPPPGDMLAAWELLAGSVTTLTELVELAFGINSPAAALAAWQWVVDDLYFSGDPQAVQAHLPEQVAAEQATRAARHAEAAAWAAFVGRVRQGSILPEDARYLGEVQELALGRRERSRVLAELGRTQTPEGAHGLLLELGVWDVHVNPYPQRLGVAVVSPTLTLPPLPDEPRRDLTHLPAFAIDDVFSHDPDDAVSRDGDRLWIHIADVAALVTVDSPADLEARGRGATLYLPETTATMLPEQATQRLALGLQEVSPALSFGMRMAPDGTLHDLEITPSLVRVQRLSYQQAESRLDDEPLRTLHAWMERHAARRRRQGAIQLNLPEVRVKVQDDEVSITPLEMLQSRELVAEAMMIAGEAVAQFAVARGLPMPFTVQQPGDFDDDTTPDTLAGMFAARRRMNPSRQSLEPEAHAGLGLSAYCRVTSPLRRYLDLVVHQQLRLALAGEPPLSAAALLERIGTVEAVQVGIRRAEQWSRQHWTLVYLQRQKNWQGEGLVVEKNGPRATVLIPALAWEVRAHLRHDLPLDTPVRVTFTGAQLPLLDAQFRVG